MSALRVLCVAATSREAAVFPSATRVVVTGVGAARSALELALALREEPADLVVGAGIAGAYPASGLALEQVVAVSEEGFVDLGAEDGEKRLDLWSLGFDPGYPSRFPLSIPAAWHGLVSVRGGTCSLCTGSEATQKQREALGVGVESMEGAGWALACWRLGIPLAQLRAISNFAGPRDRDGWRIDPALRALASFLEESCPA